MIKTILESVQEISSKSLQLYFITRLLREGYSKKSRSLEKYEYKIYQVDINEEIRKHLYDLTLKQLQKIIDKNFELVDYDVISDDVDFLLKYDISDKSLAFAEIINNRLPYKSQIEKVTDIEKLIMKEELWAYTIGYENNEKWFYSFRKILKSKVAIDEKDGNKRGYFQKAIRTVFNTKNNKLELMHGETINLDKQIDCIFYDDMFYVIKKTQFEQILGLEEEYKKQAEMVTEELEQTGMIEGVSLIKELIKDSPSMHKKLVRLKKVNNHNTIDKKTIKKMKSTAKTYGDTLKVNEEGKILVENKNDIESALRLLCDYYKEGKISGKDYGTYSGRQLKSN